MTTQKLNDALVESMLRAELAGRKAGNFPYIGTEEMISILTELRVSRAARGKVKEALEDIACGAKFADKRVTGNNGVALLTPILIEGIAKSTLADPSVKAWLG